jgi:hypothetical protein
VGVGVNRIGKVERIDLDGRPSANRWKMGKLPSEGGLLQYIQDLFVGEAGRFRLFCFLVTDQDPTPADYKATQMDIDRWRSSGRLVLSTSTANTKLRRGTKVWLLVYEFENTKAKGGNLVAPEQDGLSINSHFSYLGLK